MKKIDTTKTLGYRIDFSPFYYGELFRLRSKVYSYVGYVLDCGEAVVLAKDSSTGKYVALPVSDYENVELKSF